MSSIEQGVQILSATLSADNVMRRRAEDELAEAAKTPGLAELLLQLLGQQDLAQEARIAAALAFKNFVRLNWSGEGDAPLEEDERTRIRQGVLHLLFQVPAIYRRQLSQSVCIIGKRDFPTAWPDLIEAIRQCLAQSQDYEQLNAAMFTLEELVRRYRHEMRSNQLFSEILVVVGNVADPLTNLFSRFHNILMVADAVNSMPSAERNVILELLYLTVRTYHSLISQDLPEYFEDHLTVWMGGFADLLKVTIPSLESESLDTDPNLLDKLKSSICQIVTLFSQRFEDCFEEYVKLFISNIWQLLVELDNRTRFDALVNSALGFLSAICQRQQYSEYFLGENVLQMICENIIVKNLMLRNEDLEMYECEPFDFLKRDIEGSDLETRRRGASDFVKALCKFFESTVIEILSKIITSFLSEYKTDPSNNFVKQDAVFYLVSAIASKSTTERYGATSTSQLINVSDFYQQYVRDDLLNGDINALPILKCGALKYLVLFRNQLLPDCVIECLRGINGRTENSIARLFSSNHVILHHYVAYTIERLILVKRNDQPLFTSENVPIKLIIDSLFACFNHEHAFTTPYIMKALMRCFTVMDDNTAQSAHLYVNHLQQMIARAMQNSINPQVVHFIFESLCVLIRKAYTKVEGGLDSHVLKIIELIIPHDFVDFVPYALQITALLLDQSKIEREQGRLVNQEQYLTFFPYLLRAEFWTRSANVPALILVIESYISFFPQIILGQEYFSQVIGIYQRLVGLKSQDQHGIRLGKALFPYVDLPEYASLTSRELFLPLLKRVHSQKTSKFAKMFVLFLFRYTYLKGGAILTTVFEKIQPGLFTMVMEKLILPEMEEMPHTTTYEEKRIIALGAGRLVAEVVDQVGQNYPRLVDSAIAILEAFDHRRAVVAAAIANAEQIEEQYVEQTELEYSDPYCKLSYAQHVDVIGREVSNVRKYLAEAVLIQAYNSQPQSVECLSDSARNTLNSYATLSN